MTGRASLKLKAVAILFALCVLTAVLVASRLLSPVPISSSGPSAQTPLPDEKPSPVAERIDTIPKKRIESQPEAPAEQRVSSIESTDKTTDWAVIAATHNTWESASRRADSLKSQWTECNCKVFPDKGENTKYFVIVGSGLQRHDADRLRDKAASAGFPDDTYVTKLIKTTPSE